MNKELFFINQFSSRAIGDDGAFIDGWVYSSDAFCEDIHFKREWMKLEDIAYKAMLVNFSDALVMNGVPKYALVSVALPKNFSPKELEKVARGLQKGASDFGCEIIGGDTIASNKLDFSITIISQTKKPIFRKPIKEGDLIAYTGSLGRVGRDLKKLLRRGSVSKKSPFIKPNLPVKFIQKAARHIRAGMDTSDGLFDDLVKLSKLNRISFTFLRAIPKEVGCSGEEYQLLFAFEPKNRLVIERIAKATRTKVTIFAKAIRGRFENICRPNHF